MDFKEHIAKSVLTEGGILVPASKLAFTPEEAAKAAKSIGACVIKAQVPTGKRGKAGGIQLAQTPNEAMEHAQNILGMEIDDWKVESVLVEAQIPIAYELYAAIINDYASQSPMVLFSFAGGMDVEALALEQPEAMHQHRISIRAGLTMHDCEAIIEKANLQYAQLDINHDTRKKLCQVLIKLYDIYRSNDVELIEINPLVITKAGDVIALDCKLTLDDSAASRNVELAAHASNAKMTTLEEKASNIGLKYIELDGSVAILANGAGLTMSTMDMVAYYGGKPANFMEIGGESYTKAKDALEIVLANKKVKSVLVNFCGAFARTDVMAEGVVNAWKDLKSDLPIYFTIHGTGEKEAVAMIVEQLGITPFELTDDAVKSAVEAANV